jgi:hypothetical protein
MEGMKTANERYNYQRVVLRAAWLWALLTLPLLAPAAEAPKAEVFAPGVISLPQRIEFCLTMSPDEQEIFFTVRKAPGQWQIHRARRKGNAWQASTVAPFSGIYSDSEPTLSPDGKRLFFSSNRPRQGKTPALPQGDAAQGVGPAEDYDIWVVERQGAGWAAPWPLPEPVNGPGDQWRASQSLAGNLYYSSRGLWRISMDDASALSHVKLFDPQKPGALVGGHAFVAPDESYLLTAWMDGPGGKGGFDIYVSFRDEQGNWGPSLNLGDEVNSAAEEDFPSVSPNGRDLFFFRYQKDGDTESGDIFRIDAGILDALKDNNGN